MKRSRSGRPVDKAKMDAILDAAKAEIAGVGYEAAAMEVIAAKAGVAKATVYRRFKDKEKLFLAIVEREALKMTENVETLRGGQGALLDRLIAFGEAMNDLISDPSLMALELVIEQEVARHPEIGERFFGAGPALLRSQLAAMLDEARKVGELPVTEPEVAAEHLIALLYGFEGFRRRFVRRAGMDRDERRRAITIAVRLFLRAYSWREPTEAR